MAGNPCPWKVRPSNWKGGKMGRWGSRQKEMRLFLTLAITQDDVGSEFSRWLLYPEVPHCLKAKKKKKSKQPRRKPVPCPKAKATGRFAAILMRLPCSGPFLSHS